VLATKQPSATAATFAGIVRNNPGNASWSKISDFTARISRTQLAAGHRQRDRGLHLGAVALERLWRVMFAKSYLAGGKCPARLRGASSFARDHHYAAGTGVNLMGCGAHRRLVRKIPPSFIA